MASTITPESFVEDWRRYLATLEGEATRALKRRKHPAFESHFAPLLRDVFARLQSPTAMDAMRDAVREELFEVESVEAIEMLSRECAFFVEWRGLAEQRGMGARVGALAVAGAYQGDSSDDIGDEAEGDEDGGDAVGAGKTIKDSAEGLINKLPKWFRRLLKVLNELLSILRGGD